MKELCEGQRWAFTSLIMLVAEFQGKLLKTRQAGEVNKLDMDLLFENLREIKTHLAILEKQFA